MRILLDTCAILWAALEPERLSDKARTVMTDQQSEVFISPLSCAEIACLIQRGRLELDQHWKPWFNRILEINGWRVVDLDLVIVQEAYSLPGELHQDPADRFLAATARVHRLGLVTGDRKLLDYPHVTTIW